MFPSLYRAIKVAGASGTGKIAKQAQLAGKTLTFDGQVENAMFAENFMDCFEPLLTISHGGKSSWLSMWGLVTLRF
jgi:hypothetical protein